MKLIFLSLLFVIFHIASCLQNVRVIFPESVAEGGVATLLCLYDLQGEILYSVKWYRGNYEIFRYLPREKPRIRIFHLPGLYIDLNSSNAHRLVLLDTPKHLGGNFTCEVSADEPAYTTRTVTECLWVVRNTSATYEPNERYTNLFISNNEFINFNMTSGTLDMYKEYYCSRYLYSIILILFIIK